VIRILVLAALALAACAAAVQAGGPPHVVAKDRDGRTVAELPAKDGFALTYRHSYYRQPAVERFRVAKGGFRLVEIASPSEAVLDYYDVEGTRSHRGGWWTLRLARPARFERMPLAATSVGRRTLVADGRRVSLYRRDGRAAHLTIAVEGS
jgi:hypothetical protein